MISPGSVTFFFQSDQFDVRGMNVGNNEASLDSLLRSVEDVFEELFDYQSSDFSYNGPSSVYDGGEHSTSLIASWNQVLEACSRLDKILSDFANNNSHTVRYAINGSAPHRELSAYLYKLRHWAEKCPVNVIRQKLSTFIDQPHFSSFISSKVHDRVISHYIPPEDTEKHLGLRFIEEEYFMHQERNRNSHNGDASRELSTNQLSRNGASTTVEDQKYPLFFRAFHLFSFRLPNFIQLLGYHPRYLRRFLDFHQSLFHDGRISLEPKLVTYLGIMACASFDCQYLMELLKESLLPDDRFLIEGLAGISSETSLESSTNLAASNVQYDLQALVHLNHILAFTPWKLESSHIMEIVNARWPMDKLVQAVIVLTHFHSLSSFVLSCGVAPESPIHTGEPSPNRDPASTNSQRNDDSHSKEGSQFIHQLRKMPLKNAEKQHYKRVAEIDNVTEKQEGQGPVSSRIISDANLKYVGQQRTSLESFKQTDRYRMLFTSEEDVNEALDMIDSNLLDNQRALTSSIHARIDTAFSLTYNRYGVRDMLGEELSDVDTSTFRRTIPCTCLLAHGICYDDFNYDLVHFVKEKCPDFYRFIKLAVVDPQSVSRHTFLNSFPYGLDHSEKVHICILVMEARMQIELFYAMTAINKYRTEKITSDS